jgi:hypothetical protein
VGGTCDGINEYECFTGAGNFAGEGTTCAALPADIDCSALAHGCANPTPIACAGEITLVDLTGADPATEFPPEQGYVCGNAGNDPDDRAYLSFKATSKSVRVHVCDSVNPARDSLLGVLGSECPMSGVCPPSENNPAGAACTPGKDFCGYQCCEPNVPLAFVGCGDDECGFTEFMSDIQISNNTSDTALVIGEHYLIVISNWDFQTNGVFSLVCDQPLSGSCCHTFAGVCEDDTPITDCKEDDDLFNPLETCAELEPACGIGACCHPDGSCTETLPGGCPKDSNHMPGTQCSSVICNRYDERIFQCNYNTGNYIPGNEPGDEAPFGFVSQFFNDVGSNLWIGRADDFTLKGDPLNPCEITQIVFPVFHTSHDITNNCSIGGGPSCSDTAADYEGIIVVISNDEEGADEKGPTCTPNCPPSGCEPGADGDYHEGTGCVASVVYGVAAGDPPPTEGTFWTFECQVNGQTACEMTMNIDPPLVLEKNKKYWLSITPIYHEVGGYSIVWFSSIRFNGNFTQGYSSAGSQMWMPSTGTPNDHLWEIHGVKPKPGCGGCRVAGDHVFPFCLEPPQPDVDDLSCCVGGFGNVNDCPTCDMVRFAGDCTPVPCNTNLDCENFYGIPGIPCSGGRCFYIDGDDIGEEVGAFGGFPTCPPPCPSGACIGDYDGNPMTPDTCRDGGSEGDGIGMSQSDCINVPAEEGCYCGDNTTCGGPCPGCP